MAGKAPIDVARDDGILKLLKSEIIASSSSSESVTSEIRSPTSPESNLSDDEQREEDPKKRRDTESLFMPRSTTMMSSIGAASSSTHSPTSTTTPTKLPLSDPYAYHEESDDLPGTHTASSSSSSGSTTPSRLLKNIQSSHKMGDSQPRLTMVFTHNKDKQNQRGGAGGSIHSPKRSASSQLHHGEPKKQKMFGGGLYGDRDKHAGDKPSASKSKYSLLPDSQVGSSLGGQRSVSPADSQSSQDSDLYDPHLGGDSSKYSKKMDTSLPTCSNMGGSTTPSKVTSSDSISHSTGSFHSNSSSSKLYKSDSNCDKFSGGKKDNSEAAPKRMSKKDSEAMPAAKHYKKDDSSSKQKLQKEADSAASKPSTLKSGSDSLLFKTIDRKPVLDMTSFQPDSQMPTLSQEGYSPVQFEINYEDLSDSDDNPLQIDVDSTTTTLNKPTSTTERSSKHIPSSSSTTKLFGSSSHLKSDVSSSNSDSKLSKQPSPQSTDTTSPYNFTVDSPCSLSSFSYKQQQQSDRQERLEKKQQQEASSSIIKSEKDKNGSKHTKGDSRSSKYKESLHQQNTTVSQSDATSLGKGNGSSTEATPRYQSSTAVKSTAVAGGGKFNTGGKVGPGGKSSNQNMLSKSIVSSSSKLVSSSNNNAENKTLSAVSDSGKASAASSKVDTTTHDIKPHIKIEVKEEFNFIATSDASCSDDVVTKSGTSIKIKEEKPALDIKPLTIKVEKEKTIKLEKEGERSKSPKGLGDKDCSSRKNSPKLLSGEPSSSRSSPRPFTFKESSQSSNSSSKSVGQKWDSNRASPKSDRDSPKSDKSDRSDCSSTMPKVPPLKIIIPSKASSSTDRPQSHSTGHHHSHREKQQQMKVKVNLPYVLNPTQQSGDNSLVTTTSAVAMANATSNNPDQPTPVLLVKSSRNSSRASSVASGEQEMIGSDKGGSASGEDKDSNQGGVSSTQESGLRRNTRSKNNDRDAAKSVDGESSESKPDSRSDAGGDSKEEQSERRVTRSQMRQQGKERKCGGEPRETNGNKEEKEKEDSVSVVGVSVDNKDSSSTKGPITNNVPVVIASTSAQNHNQSEEIAVHPRKRKALRQRNQQDQNSTVDSSFAFFPKSNSNEKTANPYEMFLDIRKKVAKRRTEMTVVTPKAPTGFNNYLMVSCNYVLQGNSSKLNIPMLTPPNSLDDVMKEMFIEQEKARYKLRLQHLIEREKLRLSIEQEVLRVHGRAARALANQTTPLSMCAILKDEEIYNIIDPEAEEKEKIGARSRYNGRQFLSWLQDVDDKYEKIKESTLLRHHHEAESLHAVQKLEWEWKLKERTLCDNRSTPVIANLHVPMVTVNDEFELLPS